ncbi:MAG: hypothetical protein M1130_12450 [Actinobacteria bacterium]|nr:hypothetical protein [Actinomycetota bacterium]
MRLKNGELLLAIARKLILNPAATSKDMSAELSATVQSVNAALKRIREKLDAGELIPGLDEAEIESLGRAIKSRDALVKEKRQEGKALWNRVIGIMREHVVEKRFHEGYKAADIARLTGLRIEDVKGIIEGLTGCSLTDIAREMFRESVGVAEIARRLGMAQKDVKKALPRVVRVAGAYRPPASEGRRISTIKPGSPKSQRKLKKRPASISRTGLAHWCMQHYDSRGVLQLPYGCSAPGDLPRRYPREKVQLTNAEPRPSFFPAPPPSMAECTARGRRRLGYSRLQ